MTPSQLILQIYNAYFKYKNNSSTSKVRRVRKSPSLQSSQNISSKFISWIAKRFGVRGIILLFAMLISLFIWVNWSKVIALPGATKFIQFLTEAPIPKASPTSFTIAITHLENDTNGEYDRLIHESLNTLTGIDLILIDRTVLLNDSNLTTSTKLSNERARNLLKTSGADVLIWGTVLKIDGKSIPKLYWSTLPEKNISITSKRYKITDDIDLPPLFWDDISNVLQLLAVTYALDFNEARGQLLDQEITPYLTKVSSLLNGNSLSSDPIKRKHIQFLYGNALYTYAMQTGNRTALSEAVITNKAISKAISKQEMPMEWAAAQYQLGNTLIYQAQLDGNFGIYQQAIKAIDVALSVWNNECCHLDYIKAMNAYALCMSGGGLLTNNTSFTEEAIRIYQEMLKDISRKENQMDWSAMKTNLGISLSNLGYKKKDIILLNEAISAFNDALKETSREHTPLNWAAIQINIGATYRLIGEQENTTVQLQQAIKAYQEALKETPRDRMPLRWAEIQHNLGNVFRILGTRENGVTSLEDAVRIYQLAREVFVKTNSENYINWIDRDIKKATEEIQLKSQQKVH